MNESLTKDEKELLSLIEYHLRHYKEDENFNVDFILTILSTETL